MGQEPRLSHQTLQVLRAFMEDVSTEMSGADLMRMTGLMSGTIYPILIRFEEQGFLRSRWERGDPRKLKRPRRRLYTLTGAGQSLAMEAFQQLALPPLLKPVFES